MHILVFLYNTAIYTIDECKRNQENNRMCLYTRSQNDEYGKSNQPAQAYNSFTGSVEIEFGCSKASQAVSVNVDAHRIASKHEGVHAQIELEPVH